VKEELKKVFDAELGEMRRHFFELFDDKSYWERIEKALLDTCFLRYCALADRQTQLERKDYGIWRGGDLLARGTYAGPVGWVDGSGDGRWMVGIRAATVDGASVRMSAGVGVVAGSDPRAELLETDLKLRSVFEALAPGVHLDTSAG